MCQSSSNIGEGGLAFQLGGALTISENMYHRCETTLPSRIVYTCACRHGQGTFHVGKSVKYFP